MAVPKLVEGTLYIDRDRDVRTGIWGPYVKIGIVRDGKTPEQRVKELQTGNPRCVHTIVSYNAPMVENLETRLHHNYAERWVRGEWFEMDEDFIKNDLDLRIKSYIKNQKECIEDHKQRKILSSVASTGITRKPTTDEEKLHADYIIAKTNFDKLSAKAQIFKSRLMSEMGNGGGIDSILKLTKRVTPEKIIPGGISFNSRKFKTEHLEYYNKFIILSESIPKGNLTIKNIPTLAKIDAELKSDEKDAKLKCDELKDSLYGNSEKLPNDITKGIHFDYISVLGSIFDSELNMERIKSKLSNILGEDEGIEGIIQWKRESKIQSRLDVGGIKENFPKLYEDCLEKIPEKITAEKTIIAIRVAMYREYAL